MYLYTSTKLDISFAVGYLNGFVSRPTRKHCGAMKNVMRHLVGTAAKGIMYKCISMCGMDKELSI